MTDQRLSSSPLMTLDSSPEPAAGLDRELDLAAERPAQAEATEPSGGARLAGLIAASAIGLGVVISLARGTGAEPPVEASPEPSVAASAPVDDEAAEEAPVEVATPTPPAKAAAAVRPSATKATQPRPPVRDPAPVVMATTAKVVGEPGSAAPTGRSHGGGVASLPRPAADEPPSEAAAEANPPTAPVLPDVSGDEWEDAVEVEPEADPPGDESAVSAGPQQTDRSEETEDEPLAPAPAPATPEEVAEVSAEPAA